MPPTSPPTLPPPTSPTGACGPSTALNATTGQCEISCDDYEAQAGRRLDEKPAQDTYPQHRCLCTELPAEAQEAGTQAQLVKARDVVSGYLAVHPELAGTELTFTHEQLRKHMERLLADFGQPALA